MSLLYDATITRVRAPLVEDRYGQQIRDWANAERVQLAGVALQPDSSSEEMGDRSVIITGWRLVGPRGANLDLLATDRIEAAGVALEVDGKIGRYTMGGAVHHVEARLQEVSG